MALSQARHNYHEDCEAGVNKQINFKLYTSYVYQSMAHHFDRDDVALKGFQKFFNNLAEERHQNAEKLIKFQNQRGGRVLLQNIQKPDRDQWSSGLESMQTALAIEKHANEAMLDLHKVAEDHADPQMMDFIDKEFLHHYAENIKRICDHITNLKRTGPGLGEFIFSKKLLQ